MIKINSPFASPFEILSSIVSANFPSTTVVEPSAEIATNLTVKTGHMNQAYLEIIALENVLLGQVGAALTLIPTNNSTVPLTVRGASGQASNLLQVGSNVSSTDRLTLSAAGQLGLPVTGTSGGVAIGGTNGGRVSSPGANGLSFASLGGNSTSAFKFNNSSGTTVASIDNSAAGAMNVGSTSAPSVALHVGSGNTPTTATAGLQFGTESSGPSANFYRSAAGTITTDGTLNAQTALKVGGTVTVNTTAAGTYTGTAAFTVLAKDLEVRKSDGQSRIILSSPNGTRFAFKVDNTGQLISEAA